MDGSRDQLGFREWGFYLQAVQFSQTNLQFYTVKHLMNLRPTDQRKTLAIGCLSNSWQVFHPHCNVTAPS